MDSETLSSRSSQTYSGVLDQKTNRRVRHKINILIYVTLDQGNGGIIRDLSEYGVAVQAVGALRVHQHVHLRFDLPSTRVRVDAIGHVAWADTSGRAGIEFTQIGHRARQLLRDWLLMNLLATASYVSQASGICTEPKSGETGELAFAPPGRPSISLTTKETVRSNANPETLQEEQHEDVLSELWLEFSWWPVPIAARTLSSAVDALVLLVSLLLFCSIFLAITHQKPPWPTAVAASAGVLIIFSFLYRFLFVTHGAGTPGYRLAVMAARNSEAEEISEPELTRFR
jgi:PilZ domain